MDTSTAKPGNPVTKPARLLSLDALRGFDMFWIMSGEREVTNDGHKVMPQFRVKSLIV